MCLPSRDSQPNCLSPVLDNWTSHSKDSPIVLEGPFVHVVSSILCYTKNLTPSVVKIGSNQVVILVSDLRYVSLQILNVVVECSIDTKTVRTIKIVEILDMCCSITVNDSFGGNRAAHKVVFVDSTIYILFVTYPVGVVLVTYTCRAFVQCSKSSAVFPRERIG